MRISLKYKFLIPSICLLIMGMSVISLVSHVKAKEALTKVILDELDHVARATESLMSSWIHDRKLDVLSWSQQGIYKKALQSSYLGLTARSFTNKQLEQVKKDYGFYELIALADISGNVIVSSNKAAIGKSNINDRAYFKNAITKGLDTTENGLSSWGNGKPVFVISAPVKESGTVIGVLFAVFDIQHFVNKFIKSNKMVEDRLSFVILGNGKIAANQKYVKIAGLDASQFKFNSERTESDTRHTEFDLNHTRMISSYTYLEEMKWTIVISAKKEDLFLPVRNLGRLNGFVTVFVSLLVAVIIFLIANSVSRPIKEVVAGLTQMGKGKLDFRLQIKNNDEIGLIGESLNTMAGNLEESETKIKQQNRLLENAKDDLESRVEQRTLELKHLEQNYRRIFENAVEGIFQTTVEGLIINANPSFANLLGYSSVEEILSEEPGLLFPISLEKRVHLKDIIALEGKIIDHEIQLKRKNGDKFWGSISAQEIKNEDDPRIAFEGFIIDITQKREKEKALREWKTAHEANLAKSEFIANMSHEIRTPLNALLGFSELLSANLTEPDQLNYIEAMKNAGNSLLLLINDILDLSKIEAGKTVFNYEPVNLMQIFTEIEYIFKEKIKEKGLTLKINYNTDMPVALILDEARIRQILLNLVGNAVKFTEKGTITISSDTGPGKRAGTVGLTITVTDTGTGIEADKLASIFDSFQQADGTINRKYGGTGLGLSICKRLTKAMNGQILVQSKKDVGSAFIIHLKDVVTSTAYILKENRFEGDLENEKVVFEKKRALVVDDVESNYVMLKELLVKLNFDAFVATNGQDAVDMVDKIQPDIIFMDVRLPVMNGNEATKILKSDPKTKQIPIISFTGDVVAKTREEILNIGYDGYLVKPVKIDAVIAELSKYFKKKKVTIRGHDFKHSPGSINTADIINPDEFITVLKENILPACLTYENSIVINQIESFALALKDLSNKHNVPDLYNFSEALRIYTTQFDITQIKKRLKELPLMIENLIQK